MYKLVLSISLLLTVTDSYAQHPFGRPVLKDTEIEFSVNVDSIYNTLADSINRIVSVKDIPAFITDPCFVNKLPFVSTGDVRRQLLGRVVNEKAIRIILDTNDERLKQPCLMYYETEKEIAYRKTRVTYMYLLKRLQELEAR
jgi:hypothetical protein